MSKLDELIRELCPDGVQVFRLEAIAHYAKIRIDCKTINEDNYVGVENLLQNKAGKTKATSVPTTGMVIAYQKNDILIGNIRPYLRKVWLADCEGGTNGDVLTVQIEDTEKVLPQFLYYVLSSEKFFLYDIQNSKGAKMPRGSKDAVMKFEVPLPPPEVQREIVRMLDSYTESVVELQRQLTAELTARQKQYEFYRDKLLTFDVLRGGTINFYQRTLGELFDFRNGLSKGKEFFGKGTPFVRYTDVYNHRTLRKKDITALVECTEDEKERLKVSRGDVLFTRTSETAKDIGWSSVMLDDMDNCVFNGFTIKATPKTKELLPEYCAYCFSTSDFRQYVTKHCAFTTRASLTGNTIAQYRMTIPPLDIQSRIVNVLDNFEKICSDLNIGLPAEIEARQKQYEYYRDKLLTFAENGNTILSRAEQSRAEQSRAEQSRAEH